MIEAAIYIAIGALLVKAYPPADVLATKLRDYLYGLFRKSPDDDDDNFSGMVPA